MNILSRLAHSLIIVLIIMSLGACAKLSPSGAPAAPDAAENSWQAYLAQTKNNSVKPYRINLSLRYSDAGDSRRVTAILWGNGDSALRLDIMAGVGANIAKIMEEGDHFLLLAPNEGRAYFHQGKSKPLFQIGVPMPLGLRTLEEILNGRYAEAFGPERGSPAAFSGKLGLVYSLASKPLGGELELTEDGRPVRWAEKGNQGWTLLIDYDDSVPPLPRKLEVNHPQGRRAIVLIKDRDKVSAPFSREQMFLNPPPGSELLPLSEFKAPKHSK